MRHFALEQAARGVSVLYHCPPDPTARASSSSSANTSSPPSPPCARRARTPPRLSPAATAGLQLNIVPDTTWLSHHGRLPRRLRLLQTGKVLRHGPLLPPHAPADRRPHAQRGKPIGGQFSYDADNRNPYKGEVPVPTPPPSPPTPSPRKSSPTSPSLRPPLRLHRKLQPALHPGRLRQPLAVRPRAAPPHLRPLRRRHARRQPQLFHSKTSALLNLGRMLPLTLVQDVAAAAAEGTVPLASAEGFIRQLLGWREFMRHLHEQTDGYRLLRVHPRRPARPQELSPDLRTPQPQRRLRHSRCPSPRSAASTARRVRAKPRRLLSR